MGQWTAEQIPDLTGKTAVVTGANTGLGYHTALELAQHGARVLIGCRSRERGEEALRQMREAAPEGHIELLLVDMSDLDSVAAFAETLSDRCESLDLLINNAGVVMPPERRTAQGFESQFGTNFLGPYALTGRLLPLLRAAPAARIVSIASQAHRAGGLDLDDPNFVRRRYKPKTAYAQSKIAILSWTYEMQRRFAAAGLAIEALAAHPGYAATNIVNSDSVMASFFLGRVALKLGNWVFANSAHQGALCTLYAAVGEDTAGGDYIGPDGMFEMRGAPRKVSSTSITRDPDVASRLWQEAERLTQVRYALD